LEGPLIIFSEHLKKLREEKGISGPKMAKLLGMKYRSYNNYENGTFPPVLRLKDIVYILNITFDDLFEPFIKINNNDEELYNIVKRLKTIKEYPENWRTVTEVIDAFYKVIKLREYKKNNKKKD